jgi:hypothetical protein
MCRGRYSVYTCKVMGWWEGVPGLGVLCLSDTLHPSLIPLPTTLSPPAESACGTRADAPQQEQQRPYVPCKSWRREHLCQRQGPPPQTHQCSGACLHCLLHPGVSGEAGVGHVKPGGRAFRRGGGLGASVDSREDGACAQGPQETHHFCIGNALQCQRNRWLSGPSSSAHTFLTLPTTSPHAAQGNTPTCSTGRLQSTCLLLH